VVVVLFLIYFLGIGLLTLSLNFYLSKIENLKYNITGILINHKNHKVLRSEKIYMKKTHH
jgi:hypothetical protein